MNPHLISTTVLVAHWLIVVVLSLRGIMRRSPVGVSVAWIAVMFSVPFVGAGDSVELGAIAPSVPEDRPDLQPLTRAPGSEAPSGVR